MNIGALIVDDQDDIRYLMRLVIERANGGLFVSGEAADGQDALAQIDDLNPDIIVLDEMMPGLSGIETAIRIRERRPEQVMIMCTAYLNEDLERRANEAGISACITKTQILDLPPVLQRALASA
jgi:CheY-like chemotaxis protein